MLKGEVKKISQHRAMRDLEFLDFFFLFIAENSNPAEVILSEDQHSKVPVFVLIVCVNIVVYKKNVCNRHANGIFRGLFCSEVNSIQKFPVSLVTIMIYHTNEQCL